MVELNIRWASFFHFSGVPGWAEGWLTWKERVLEERLDVAQELRRISKASGRVPLFMTKDRILALARALEARIK